MVHPAIGIKTRKHPSSLKFRTVITMKNTEQHLTLLEERYPKLRDTIPSIRAAFLATQSSFSADGRLFICGNGGSAADAEHIVGELMKGFYKKRPLSPKEEAAFGDLAPLLQGALPAIALTQHSALSSAYLNDVDPAMIFAQQLYGWGRKGDVLLALSTSGNAKNVANAARVAKAKGITVIGMTGSSGGTLATLSDICIKVPETVTAYVQELHLPVYHTLCAMLEEYFFED